jgi:hypothetical protein
MMRTRQNKIPLVGVPPGGKDGVKTATAKQPAYDVTLYLEAAYCLGIQVGSLAADPWSDYSCGTAVEFHHTSPTGWTLHATAIPSLVLLNAQQFL